MEAFYYYLNLTKKLWLWSGPSIFKLIGFKIKIQNVENNILLYTPNIEFLSKQHGVVKVRNGSIHCIAVSHLHHRSAWFTFHKFHLKENVKKYFVTF